MPTCKNCNQKWSWKQTIKKTFTLFPEMICPYCGETQYQTKGSKMKAPFLSLIVLLPLFIQGLFEIPVVFLLGSIPVLGIISFLLYPFLVELSDKEEYFEIFKDNE